MVTPSPLLLLMVAPSPLLLLMVTPHHLSLWSRAHLLLGTRSSLFRGRGGGSSRCQHRVSDTLGAICGEMVADGRGCHSVLQWGDSGTEIPRRRRRHGSWSARFMPCVGRAYVSAKDPPERGGTVWSALAVGAVRGAVDIPCHGFHGTRVRSGTASKTREDNRDVGPLSSRWSRSMTEGPARQGAPADLLRAVISMPLGPAARGASSGTSARRDEAYRASASAGSAHSTSILPLRPEQLTVCSRPATSLSHSHA